MATPSIAMIPSGYKAGKVYSVLPTDGAGDLTFTRASSATRVNKEGLRETVATGVPRLDYSDGGCPSLLLEPQSTNLIVNSELNNVENIVVSAVAHTISFYGTGSITLSGVHSATLSGTGANDRVSLTFTPSAGTLTCTDSGNVDNKQVEARPYATSYIPTAGAISTRLQDTANGAGDASTFNDSEGVLYVEISALADDGIDRKITLSDNSLNNSITIGFSRFSGKINAIIHSGGNIQTVGFGASGVTQTNNNKFALAWGGGEGKFYVNGILTSLYTNITPPIGLNVLNFSLSNGFEKMFSNTKDLRVYNTALTDAELISLTTL